MTIRITAPLPESSNLSLHERLTALKVRRAKSGPLPAGIAPTTSSNSFRGERNINHPMAKRCDHWLSQESRDRFDSTLKASASEARPASLINLGAARPVSKYFPWESMAIQVQKPSRQCWDETSKGSNTLVQSLKGEDAYDLGNAMNYGFAAGSPQLLRFVTEHVQLVHDPLYQDWVTCLTSGTTSALDVVFRMLCNRDEWILTESYTYSGAIEAAKPLGIKLQGVQMDDVGLIPEELDEILQSWDTAKGRKPFVLYTVPTGQNPTAATQTQERRQAIYAMAEKHDLCIVEDDPYYFLQLDTDLQQPGTRPGAMPVLERYLKNLPPSYLSLDRSGRVIRLDSTSKILAPGLRCGWITGCSQLIAKFLNHTEFSSTSPSGPSQVLLYKLFEEAWGHEGLLRWLLNLSSQYQLRRNVLLEACRRHLPLEICHWQIPSYGMFLWIRLNTLRHPQACNNSSHSRVSDDILCIEDCIHAKAKANGVQLSKGSWFAVDRQLPGGLAFRLTFAACPEDELELAVVRFANAVRVEFGMK